MFTDTVSLTAQLVTWISWGIAITLLVMLRWRTVATARPRRAERGDGLLPVASRSEAFEVAHSVLAATTCDAPRLVGVPRSFDHDGLWRTVAEPPLAALVYTASRQPEPLAWLEYTVRQLCGAEQDAGWRAALEAVAAVDSALCEWVKNASAMERRQRGSVAVVMRDALSQYVAAQR